ncbi:MAG: ArnT family glycosyltransferase [Segniliparus sp.]|uniref:ArnT family glycosyltransferase n=1 Tax=Segniliparus sp. TaxID=2804064 RepID=UPI003F3C156F
MTTRLTRDASASRSEALRAWAHEHREGVQLAAALVVFAAIQLWDITINGMSNDFYASAVLSGSQSWEAWFFGSFDPQNFITVDKPAGGMWLMGLSARVFGFSSASMLVPQALLGVASAWLLYASVRRLTSHAAGLVAIAVFAATPIATVMFRDNNPDAAMVFGMMVGAYGTTRALGAQRQQAAVAWLALAGAGVGFAFLAKTFQGLMTLPALGLVYLLAEKFDLKRRIAHLAVGAAAAVASSGWWFLAVALTPAASRPFVGGSTSNSELELALGSNGFNRLLGGGRYGEGGGPGFAGPPSLWRVFEDSQGLHVAWLIPTALLALALGFLACRGNGSRSNPVWLALVLWGGWLVSNYLVLTYMQAAFHPYYVFVLAPPIAAVVGIGSWLLWQRRSERLGRWGAAALVVVSGVTAWSLLGRHADWLPPLRWALLGGAVLVAAVLASGRAVRDRRAQAAVAVAALVFGLGGSAAVALENVVVPKVPGGMPLPGPNWADGPLAHFGNKPGGNKPGGRHDAPAPARLHDMLRSANTRWAAAVSASFGADSFILEDKVAVMAIGGFGGRDEPITLDQFVSLAQGGKVRYYLAQPDDEAQPDEKGPPAQPGQPGTAPPRPQAAPDDKKDSLVDKVEAWVKAHYSPEQVGDFVVYDLAAPRRG